MAVTPESPERMPRVLDGVGYGLCVGLVAYTLWNWGTGFFDPYLQNDDTRISLFPFHAFHSGLFQDDYVATAMRAFVPWLYQGIVYLLTFVVDLLAVPKIIQIVALVWCGFHGFSIGHRRAGGAGGLLGLYLVLHMFPIIQRTAGGLPRGFAFPLLLMLADGLDAKRVAQGAAGAVLGFALYPPAGFIGALVFGFWMLGDAFAHRGERAIWVRRLLQLAATAMLSVVVLLPSLSPKPEYGRIHSLEDAKAMPEFGLTGRLKVIPLETLPLYLDRVRELMSRSSDDALLPQDRAGFYRYHLSPLEALLLLGCVLGLARLTSAGSVGFLFLAVGVLGFSLATAVAFRLYSPGRMLLYSLPVAAIVLLTQTGSGLGRRGTNAMLARAGAFGCFVVLAITQGVAFSGPPYLTVDARPNRDVFELVKTLPKDALIAGHPTRMNDIPLWGERAVLVTTETAQPWFTGMWEELGRRMDSEIDAYYATELEPVHRLRREWGVDYVLVHEDDLPAAQGPPAPSVFDPFDAKIEALKVRRPLDRVWLFAPEDAVVGRASGFMLIDLEQFLDGSEEREKAEGEVVRD